MAAFAVDLDKILAAAHVVYQVFVRVQLAPELVGVSDLQFTAEGDFARVGL